MLLILLYSSLLVKVFVALRLMNLSFWKHFCSSVQDVPLGMFWQFLRNEMFELCVNLRKTRRVVMLFSKSQYLDFFFPFGEFVCTQGLHFDKKNKRNGC